MAKCFMRHFGMLRSQSSSATLIAGWRLVQLQPTQLLQPPHSAHFCAMKHTGASIAAKTAIRLQSGFRNSDLDPDSWISCGEALARYDAPQRRGHASCAILPLR